MERAMGLASRLGTHATNTRRRHLGAFFGSWLLKAFAAGAVGACYSIGSEWLPLVFLILFAFASLLEELTRLRAESEFARRSARSRRGRIHRSDRITMSVLDQSLQLLFVTIGAAALGMDDPVPAWGTYLAIMVLTVVYMARDHPVVKQIRHNFAHRD